MQKSKMIVCIAVVILIVLAISAPCFAVGAAVTATDAFISLWSVYASSHGLSTVFSTDGMLNNKLNTFDENSAEQAFTSLYDEYNSTLESSKQKSLNDWASWALNNASTTAGALGAYGYDMVLNMSSDLVKFFDEYANWILEYKLNTTRDASGHYHTTGNFANSNIYTHVSTGNFYACPVSPSSSFASISLNGINLGKNNFNHDYWAATGQSAVFLAFYSAYADWAAPVWFSDSPFQAYIATYNGYNGESVIVNDSVSLNGYYWKHNDQYLIRKSDMNTAVPIYTTLDAAKSAYQGGVVAGGKEKIDMRPKDKYNEDGITVPYVGATDYVSDAMTQTIADTLADADSVPLTLDEVLAKIKELVLENADPITDDLPNPNPVIPPFVPFDGIIPSFDFHFSSIWYYVVNWVQSLGSGFGLFSNIWNNIPYAMVLPIYASAVVVIVLSVFKRFV